MSTWETTVPLSPLPSATGTETQPAPTTVENARRLAEHVMSMMFVSGSGHLAKKLAMEVLGIPDPFQRTADEVCIVTNGTTRFLPRDEPVFLLRAQDVAAADTVRSWADLAEALGAAPDIAKAARDHADKMDAWEPKKTPDLCKGDPNDRPAALRATPAIDTAAKPVVKTLEWVRVPMTEFSSRAETSLGSYSVWTHHEAEGSWFARLYDSSIKQDFGDFTSEADAKAAAQTDFERRVLACLHPAPAALPDDTLRAELAAVSAAIGSTRFMDPPDGGSVTLAEQVERMREALYEAEQENIWRQKGAEELRAEVERLRSKVDELRASEARFSLALNDCAARRGDYALKPSPTGRETEASLRAALEPFARFAEIADMPDEPDYEKFIYRGKHAITFGHLRAARAALGADR